MRPHLPFPFRRIKRQPQSWWSAEVEVKRLVKDGRPLLPPTEVMIVWLTSPLPDMPCLSSPMPRLMHGRRHAHFSHPILTLNLCTRQLFILSGYPPFSTNLFRLAYLLALLIVINLYFLIGVLAWFINITEVAFFESVEVFRKDSFLALYFSLFSSMILL